MDLKQIKQIIDLMKRSELSEFAIEEEGFKLRIRRGANGLPAVTSSGGTTPPFAPAAQEAVAVPAPVGAGPVTPPVEAGIGYIKSPMVGTFYTSPSPESPIFVEIGAKVTSEKVVCIIEAMKIMNEIQAEATGTILECLVENGAPVEYGQRLFKIKTA